MRFQRCLWALGALAPGAAVLAIVPVACSDPTVGVPSSPSGVAPAVTITEVGPAVDQINGATGSTFLLTLAAAGDDAGIPGLSLALSGQPAGVTVTPATVVTDASGQANAYAFVPYDVQGVVIAAGGGSLPAVLAIPNGALTLAGAAGKPTDFGPSGATFPVTVRAETPDAGVAGVAVAFTAQAPAVLASAPTVTTGADGQAVAYVFLPYDTRTVVVASGGSSLAQAVQLSNPAVALAVGTPEPAGALTPTGQYWTVPVSATVNGSPVQGLPLAFTPLQPGMPSTSTFMTGADGDVAANFFAPWGPNELVQITGGGSVVFATLAGAGNPIALSPLCWVDEVDAGPGVYRVGTVASAGDAGAVPGVSVAFSAVGPGGASVANPSFQPATAVTNGAGLATSIVTLGVGVAAVDAGADAGGYEVAVQATAGASTQLAVIPFGAADGGVCPP